MSYTVIIPSKKASNLARCIEAVLSKSARASLLIVDDGVNWAGIARDHFNVIDGVKPFVYARNCNLGIRACSNDVILLNDDALLETSIGFERIEQASLENPDFGIISAVTDVVGNSAQRPRGVGLRQEPRTVAFVCVYIPRRTINHVGLLDERFTAYGWEDNDYCRRVRNAGLKIGILDDCFVNHSSLNPTFRRLPNAAGDVSAGRELYVQKWGDAR